MAVGLAATGCREPLFHARAYLVNRTDGDLLVDMSNLSGRCDAIWELGAGVIREDDFGGAEAAARIPPQSVAPLGDCAVRVGVEDLRETLTWDPSLAPRAIHDPPGRDELEDRTQLVDIVRRGGRLELELPDEVVRMSLLQAGAEPPPSPCREAGVPRLGFSAIDGPMSGVLARVEARDGCLRLELPSEHEALGWELEDAGVDALQDEDAGVHPVGRVVPQAVPGVVYLCMPEELFPFAAGDELSVSTNGTEASESGIVLTRRVNGLEQERIGLFKSFIGSTLRLPATRAHVTQREPDGRPQTDASGALVTVERGQPIEATLSSCGLVRDQDGVLWQPLDVTLGGSLLSAGEAQSVDGVTYYVGRAMQVVPAPYRSYPDVIEWLEVHP